MWSLGSVEPSTNCAVGERIEPAVNDAVENNDCSNAVHANNRRPYKFQLQVVCASPCNDVHLVIEYIVAAMSDAFVVDALEAAALGTLSTLQCSQPKTLELFAEIRVSPPIM